MYSPQDLFCPMFALQVLSKTHVTYTILCPNASYTDTEIGMKPLLLGLSAAFAKQPV